VKHYILIEVRERETGRRLGAGLLRTDIHRFARVNGLDIATAIIREDRTHTRYGQPNPYSECKEVMLRCGWSGTTKS
jgi:hypothetical protein